MSERSQDIGGINENRESSLSVAREHGGVMLRELVGDVC